MCSGSASKTHCRQEEVLEGGKESKRGTHAQVRRGEMKEGKLTLGAYPHPPLQREEEKRE